MSLINQTVLDRARVIVRTALYRGEPSTDVYPIAVGLNRVYASADPAKIIGADVVTESGTLFHVGCRR